MSSIEEAFEFKHWEDIEAEKADEARALESNFPLSTRFPNAREIELGYPPNRLVIVDEDHFKWLDSREAKFAAEEKAKIMAAREEEKLKELEAIMSKKKKKGGLKFWFK